MPSVQGAVKCQGKTIIGIFHINGDPRRVVVEVNPRSLQLFECSNATLTYDSVAQLSGDCNWSGTIGTHDLKMNFGGGLNIVGQITVALQSSTQTAGAGTWQTVEVTLPPTQMNSADETQSDISDARVNLTSNPAKEGENGCCVIQ